METTQTQVQKPDETRPRIEWLDHAKGICIILVVMLYGTDLAADRAGHEGWLHSVAHFAKPFRMPDFFLLSGLLLSLVIARPWRLYVDRKVVHFAYFYVLWLTILFAFQAPSSAAKEGWSATAAGYAIAYVKPYSMLWFIYLLPIFFVVTKALRKAPVPLVWAAAAALQMWQPDTYKVLEKFNAYYVFFYTGYVAAPWVFRLVPRVTEHHAVAAAALGAWALLNGYMVFTGKAAIPGLSLALALLGAGAVMVFASWVSGSRAFRWLAYCGEHTIVIYLAFFIPMVITRKLVAMTGLVHDVGLMSLIASVAGIVGALALYWLVRGTRLKFLFERPRWASIVRPNPAGATAADPDAARSGAAAS